MSMPMPFRLTVFCSLAAIGILMPQHARSIAADVAAENVAADAHAGLPQFSRVYPHLAAMSDSYSEAGIGAVVPWAGRLWYVSYVAHKAGARVGLYEVMPDLAIRHRPESIVGTHAGRMIHRESNQLILGPYVIDASGNVRVLKQLAENERVTAIARHLFDPAHKVYVQAMEGRYYEADVRTLDFCFWQDRLVLAGDQNSSMGHRHRTGGQPQSNLWFGSLDQLRGWGRPAGWGGPWLDDAIEAGRPSEPFFIGGFTRRSLHLVQGAATTGGPSPAVPADDPVAFTLGLDRDGSGNWSKYQTVDVPAGGYAWRILPDELPGCWMRITADRTTTASAQFIFGPREPSEGKASARNPGAPRAQDAKSSPLPLAGEGLGVRESLFQSLPPAEQKISRLHAALLPFADRLWISSYRSDATGKASEGLGLYEVDERARAVRRLESIDGIFYETTGLGHAWFIRPIATHDRVVSDFCSWRGLTVLAGVDAAKPAGPGLIAGPNVAVWAGKTDDLWKFGPARGQGGPWLETAVRAGDVSEPYLMTNFDHKRVELRHDADGPVEFTILVDPLGTRKSWKTYKRLTVPAGQTVIDAFPEGFAAHWVRMSVDRDCRATAWLVYD